MMIEVKRLGFSCSPSLSSPEVFTLKERDGLLQQLSGKHICIDFQEGIDGAQTAARLIKETLPTFGVIFKDLKDDVDSYVWIQAGSRQEQFAFIVVDPSDKNHYLCYECGPFELTASIMMAIYNFFHGATKSSTAEKLETMLLSHNRQDEDEIVLYGEQWLEALITFANDSNRNITAAFMTQNWKRALKSMQTLECIIRVLGRIGSSKAISTILDALGDSALSVASAKQQIDQIYDDPNPFRRHDMIALGADYDLRMQKQVAESLNKASIEALARVGKPAVQDIKKYLDDSSPPIQKALKKALKKIERKRWQFWK